MLKVFKFLRVVEDSRLNWMIIVLIVSLVKVGIKSDVCSLGIFLITLLSYHWDAYHKYQKSQQHENDLNSMSHKVSELESKVSSLTMVSAFRGKYGTS